MKISSFKLYQYALPLHTPVFVRGQIMQKREGVFIQLRDEYGHEGWGEIAPLPNFSRETIESSVAQLKELTPQIINKSVSAKIVKLDGFLGQWFNEVPISSSVRFGLEMALLNLISNAKHHPIYVLISQEHHEHVRLSGFLQGTLEETVKQAKDLVQRGFVSAKLKVGQNLKEDIEKVQAINAAFDGKAMLHLDANQSWTYDQAVEFGHQITCAAVEYIEEPFADTSKIPEFFNETMIPVALDESLMKLRFEDVKSIEGVDYIILKPMIQGGLEKTWSLMEQARRVGIQPVVSSSYESSLGILMLANLAGSVARDSVAGLDTLKYFKEDILHDPLVVDHGKMDVRARRITSQDINFDRLIEIF